MKSFLSAYTALTRIARRLTLAVLVACLLAVVAQYGSSAASQTPTRLVDYTAYVGSIQNNEYGSAACLHADLRNITTNGDMIQTWSCNGWLNQSLTVREHSTGFGDGGPWYTIINADGGKCLDADARTLPANGTKVQLWTCTGAPNQSWLVYPSGGGYVLKNGQATNLCLDADARSLPSAGTKVQVWSCNGGENEIWHIPGSITSSWSYRALRRWPPPPPLPSGSGVVQKAPHIAVRGGLLSNPR
jgi:hypothetical protein